MGCSFLLVCGGSVLNTLDNQQRLLSYLQIVWFSVLAVLLFVSFKLSSVSRCL